MSKITWPAWFNSPDGKKAEIFKHESDVPRGWTSGAEKITVEAMQAPVPKSVAPLANTVDAHGHAFNAEMHTGTMTKAGLWRMKPGVSRPAPLTPLQHDL